MAWRASSCTNLEVRGQCGLPELTTTALPQLPLPQQLYQGRYQRSAEYTLAPHSRSRALASHDSPHPALCCSTRSPAHKRGERGSGTRPKATRLVTGELEAALTSKPGHACVTRKQGRSFGRHRATCQALSPSHGLRRWWAPAQGGACLESAGGSRRASRAGPTSRR